MFDCLLFWVFRSFVPWALGSTSVPWRHLVGVRLRLVRFKVTTPCYCLELLLEPLKGEATTWLVCLDMLGFLAHPNSATPCGCQFLSNHHNDQLICLEEFWEIGRMFLELVIQQNHKTGQHRSHRRNSPYSCTPAMHREESRWEHQLKSTSTGKYADTAIQTVIILLHALSLLSTVYLIFSPENFKETSAIGKTDSRNHNM